MREPDYELRKTLKRFDARLVPLWIEALKRGDGELIREAAEAIAAAKKIGYPMDEGVAEQLLASFRACTDPVARRSLAATLVAFDYKPAADAFWKASQQADYQLACVTEPALGSWQHRAAVARNLERLGNPLTPVPLLHLAFRVVQEAGETGARDDLLEIVNDPMRRSDIRVAAARTLGQLFTDGLTPPARQLHARDRGSDPMAGLLSVQLLARHDGDGSVPLLEELAADPLAAVQAAALDQLRDIGPDLAARFALDAKTRETYSVTHPDANVRRVLIEAVYAVQQLESIPVLTRFLDDPHPQNRTEAGDGLFALWKLSPEAKRSVEEHVMTSFDQSSWRVLERAAILAAGMDLNPAARKLVPLLRHSRGEVGVAAGFALKRLAVEETLPEVLAQLDRNIKVQPPTPEIAPFLHEQTKHLCEQLGIMRYIPADRSLRLFIPKMPQFPHVTADPRCRQVAIWALGKLHEGRPDPVLTDDLIGRLTDLSPMNPEFEEVRESSAYALGWMGATKAEEPLRKFASRGATVRNSGTACAWAIEKITGTAVPLPEPVDLWDPTEWFLRPDTRPE